MTAATIHSSMLALGALLLSTSVRSQDPTTETNESPATRAARGPTAKLHAALRTMAELESVAFETRSSDKPKQAQPAGVQGFAVLGNLSGNRSLDGVKGTWSQDACWVSYKDEPMIFARGRMVTEGDDGWVLRDTRRADGSTGPLVLDPGLWFTVLAELEPEVIHSGVGTLDDRPIQLLSVTLDKAQVAELDWAGLLPSNPDPFGGINGAVFARAINIGGGNVKLPLPERMVDLVFYVDPATNLIHKICARRQDQQNVNIAGNVQIMINGIQQGAAADEEEEEEVELPEGAEPRFDEGFPVRPKEEREKLTSYGFELIFSQHGQAALAEIPAVARRLLGLR